MNYYIIAGEASGDLHGANLIKQIKHLDNTATFRGFGGDLMEAEGMHLVKHIKELAFMGFVEVIKNLSTIKANLKLCEADIIATQPQAIIFIDYPGFNLRIAKIDFPTKLKKIYYISPTVWAWKKSRINIIKKHIDQLYVILPFEKPFYKKHDYNAAFLGHPLLDAINTEQNEQTEYLFKEQYQLPDKKIIALLPGSRHQELAKILPIMLKAIEPYTDYQFIIAGAPGLKPNDYSKYININSIKVIFGETYNLLQSATAAIVTSGTATLETAIFKTPQLVCYKTNPINFAIAKMLVNVKYISLVNLIMDQEVVKEFIQQDCTINNIQDELEALLNNTDYRTEMIQDYEKLYSMLGGSGASNRIAERICKQMTNK